MVKIEGPVWYTTNQPTNGKRTCMVYFIRKNMSRIFFKHCQARRRRPSPHLNLRPEMRMWILTQWRQNHPFFWGFRYLCQPTHTGDTLSLSISLSLSLSPSIYIYIYIYILNAYAHTCPHSIPFFCRGFSEGLPQQLAQRFGCNSGMMLNPLNPSPKENKRAGHAGVCRELPH